MKDSCKGYASCFSLSGGKGSSVGSISTSCNADLACYNAGYTGAITSNLNGCCNAASACKVATEATLPAQCKNSKVRKCDAVSAKNSGWNAFNDSLLLAIHSLSSTKSLDILGGEAACAKLKPRISSQYLQDDIQGYLDGASTNDHNHKHNYGAGASMNELLR